MLTFKSKKVLTSHLSMLTARGKKVFYSFRNMHLAVKCVSLDVPRKRGYRVVKFKSLTLHLCS